MYKQGEFKGGWSKNHPTQMKKHTSQMSKYEKEYLVEKVRNIRNVSVHPHLQWKKDTGQITYDIMNMTRMFRAKNLSYHIKEFSTIQVEGGRIDHRILIRSNRVEHVDIDDAGRQRCNLMFVISLDTYEIITAYYVHVHNHFESINMDRYDETLDIIAILDSDYRRRQKFNYNRDELIDDLTVDEWIQFFGKG